MKHKKLLLLFAAALIAALALPATAFADDEDVYSQPMYRLYNPYSGEHFYTADQHECVNVRLAGWNYEGIGWYAPSESKTPVYRLYNKYAGDHHYTTNRDEVATLVKAGWTDEGIGWYSDDKKTVALYRQYNPYAQTGTHNYTTAKSENDSLVKAGWNAEGIGWYGTDKGEPVGDIPLKKISGEWWIMLYQTSGTNMDNREYMDDSAGAMEMFIESDGTAHLMTSDRSMHYTDYVFNKSAGCWGYQNQRGFLIYYTLTPAYGDDIEYLQDMVYEDGKYYSGVWIRESSIA